MPTRRRLLALSALAALAALGPLAGPAAASDCLRPLAPELAGHDLVLSAFAGLNPADLWDAHAHLIGTGAGGSGAYVHPSTQSWLAPIERLRRRVLAVAACVDDVPEEEIDRRYVERLRLLLAALPPGFKLLLYAFDFAVDDDGAERPERSTFHTPNEYAAAVAQQFPQHFEWVASVHPYRADALARLDAAARRGARAVKWLPSAMNIDPASPRCDGFYGRLKQLDLPLVIHCGEEMAAPGARQDAFNNPLRVRRPLEHGVRVVVAHAASLGRARDLDAAGRGGDGPHVTAFSLFERLLREPRYEGLLYGDLSAVFQRNRTLEVQQALIVRSEWHPRLLHGSDYPLPGLGLVYSLDRYVDAGMIDARDAQFLDRLRPQHPLLFEFVLKRTLSVGGRRLSDAVFHTRPFFTRSRG
ncbi:MAG: amidohydrolase family protein [Burkholderiaceae bacterium]